MNNLDLNIIDIFHGDTAVIKIMKGDIKKWPLSTYTVTTTLTNITSDAPATILENSSLVVNLSVNTGHYMDNSSVVVMMGNTDITSTAYSNGVVTIANVTGNVSITASTMFDAQVEYLQGDGTAYINTGVKVASTVRFDIDLYASNPQGVSAYYLFGGRVGANSGCMYVYQNDAGNYKWYYGAKNSTITGISGNSVNINNNTNSSARYLYVNDKYVAVASQSFTTDIDFFLFCMNNGGNPTATRVSEPLYYAKLYTSSTLVRDYIPVRKNGVGYLFDKVNKVLYGNVAGSGAFTYGNDV